MFYKGCRVNGGVNTFGTLYLKISHHHGIFQDRLDYPEINPRIPVTWHSQSYFITRLCFLLQMGGTSSHCFIGIQAQESFPPSGTFVLLELTKKRSKVLLPALECLALEVRLVAPALISSAPALVIWP